MVSAKSFQMNEAMSILHDMMTLMDNSKLPKLLYCNVNDRYMLETVVCLFLYL